MGEQWGQGEVIPIVSSSRVNQLYTIPPTGGLNGQRAGRVLHVCVNELGS